MNYKKMWDTLKAEAGYRWIQPDPTSMMLRRLIVLMNRMEKRAKKKRNKDFEGLDD